MAAKDFYVCEYTEGGWLEKRLSINFAEDEGFKPPIPKKGIPDFESSAFDHSANLPRKVMQRYIKDWTIRND